MTWIRVIAKVVAIGLLLGVARPMRAQEERPVLSVYQIETGGASAYSNYLSPLRYNGAAYGLTGSWMKLFNHWPDRCLMRFEAGVNFDNTRNPTKSASIYGLTARFAWGLSWYKNFTDGWRVSVGPMLDIYGGALYQTRNGNNPAAALASVGIDAAAALQWKGRFGKIPVIIANETAIPTLSGFFCPEYGESYYEIYLGNRRNLAHLGWWGNAPGINNLLSIKMNFGKTGLTLGYRLDVRNFNANHLRNQVIRNAVTIGVIPNGW